jgi:glutathione S-transferase
MTKPKLTYFDAPASRGEECRLALHVAGIDFEDVRLKRPDWMGVKPNSPFGSVPFLEMPGQPPLGQSNAILVLIGRLNDLHPKDLFEAARHEALMCHAEDLRHAITPSMRMSDDEEKQKARAALANGYLPTWAANTEKHLSSDGPFISGTKMHVADIKLYLSVQWLASGALDHIPATVFDSYPKLNRVYDAVKNDARIRAWYAKS